jgi:hypothetical protein
MKTVNVLELFGNCTEIEKKGDFFKVSEPDLGDLHIEADEAMQAKIIESILGEDFVLTSTQVEKILGCSYATVYTKIKTGELPALGTGKRNFFDVKQVLRIKAGLPAVEAEAEEE